MELVSDLATTKYKVDPEKKLFVGSFNGDVTLEDYKSLLIGVANMVDNGTVQYVLMDRRNVGKIATECRIWAKEVYVKKYIKKAVPKARKVAIVQSKSTISNLYARAIYATFSAVYPSLSVRSFNSYEDGLAWVEGIKATPNQGNAKDASLTEALKLEDLVPDTNSNQEKNEKINAPENIEKVKDSLFKKVLKLFFP